MHGVAADADTRALPEPVTRELMHDLVRERAAAGHDADRALPVDVARHDADLGFARRDDAGAVGADQAGRMAGDELLHLHHVRDRDPLGDADDQRHASRGGLQDGIGSSRRGDEDQRAVGAGSRDRRLDGVPDRELLERGPPLAGRHAADDLGAVLPAPERVEQALPARDALHEHAGRSVDKDAHGRAPRASATAAAAPAPMSSTLVKSSPESASIFLPSSTLVPSIRTTTGRRRPSRVLAAINPSARRSQRRMPPNTLMNTARTLGSEDRMRNAFSICSGDAPPPTSRKLAGSPPDSLMMSIVAMASPAPLTMHPTLPSSLM